MLDVGFSDLPGPAAIGPWSYGGRTGAVVKSRRDKAGPAKWTFDDSLFRPVGADRASRAGPAVRPVRGRDAALRVLATSYHGSPDGHVLHGLRLAGPPRGTPRRRAGSRPRRPMA